MSYSRIEVRIGQRPESGPQLELGKAPDPAPVPVAPPETKPIIPRWYYFAADVVLVGLALAILLKTPAIHWSQRFFCAGLILVGGLFGMTAVWNRKN